MNTPEHFVSFNKAAVEAFQALALKSIDSMEKLAELNLQATKASFEESAGHIRAMLSAKDVKELGDLAVASTQPNSDKLTAYAKHVYDITSEASAEVAKLMEKAFADGNKQLTVAIESISKNAPAGSEGIVTFVKQAVTAANSAVDQMNKATKQAVEMAEANIAAATKAAPRAKKAA
jgi:phasin family protein